MNYEHIAVYYVLPTQRNTFSSCSLFSLGLLRPEEPPRDRFFFGRESKKMNNGLEEINPYLLTHATEMV